MCMYNNKYSKCSFLQGEYYKSGDISSSSCVGWCHTVGSGCVLCGGGARGGAYLRGGERHSGLHETNEYIQQGTCMQHMYTCITPTTLYYACMHVCMHVCVCRGSRVHIIL